MDDAIPIIIFACDNLTQKKRIMKKAFLFLFTATIVAAMSFSSCTNPPVNPDDPNPDKRPNDTTQVEDSTNTGKPGDNDSEYKGMSEQWIEVNKTIKKRWSTTTTIPEPNTPYEVIECKAVAPFGSWKSGGFEISFDNIECVKTYPDVLKKAGWQSKMNGNEEQGYTEWWSDMTDYMCYVYYDEMSGMIMKIYFYYRPDTGMQPGKWQ